MKISTNKLINILFKLCMVFAMWFISYISFFSSTYAVENGYGSYKYFFYGYHPLVFGIVFFISSLYILRNILTRLSIEEEYMRLYRFNKTIVLLKYKDIKEIGIGEAYSIRGKKRKLYFSPFALSKQEKENLDLVQDKVIYFSSIDEAVYSKIIKKTDFVLDDPRIKLIINRK